MTREAPYRITTAPARHRTARTWRGILAVLVLLITAADDLASAVTGWPPAARIWRQLADAITTTYRHGAASRPAPAPMIEPERETDG